jgi:pimeloyl-ACP methyl ester carboxylesterase
VQRPSRACDDRVVEQAGNRAGKPTLHVEERGSGTPLLLIQGLGYAVWAWRNQLEQLAAHHRVIAFDNRGAGRSQKPPGPYSIDELAADAARVLDERGLAGAAIVGLSMGGFIAQTLALARPELVRRLVLVGTSAGGPDALPQPEETRQAWAAARGLPPEEFARATMQYSFAPGWTDAHAAEYESLLAARIEFPTPPDAWAAQYAACEEFLARGAPVEEIEAPTLVVHGRLDRIVDPRNGDLLARRIPSARLLGLPGCGHQVPLEAPDRFNAAVLEFAARVSGPVERQPHAK